jgi:hypothetical protein
VLATIRAQAGNRQPGRYISPTSTSYATALRLDHPAITTVVRRSCSGASQDLCAALRTLGSRPARCTVSVAPRGTAIGAGQPTPAPTRPYVHDQTTAGVYRI